MPLEKKRPFRICILGNSVGLRMRPRRKYKSERNYCELLMRDHIVFNRCRAGTMITEQFRYMDDDLIAHFPDITILNFGIVELFHRRTFRYINNQPIRNYYNNGILGRNYTFGSSAAGLLARAINALTNRVATMLGISWQWLDTNRYLRVLRDICDCAIAETSTVIVILEVPRLSPASSKYSPTTDHRIRSVNSAIHAWAQESEGRIIVLPVNTLIPEDSALERLIPDGIHFSALGHRIVYRALQRTISTLV